MDNLEEKLKRDYKLIAFDLDGTLLDSNKNITSNVREAIDKAYKADKIFVFSTGRNIDELKTFRDIEAFRYSIGINGAYIYDLKENKLMASHPIPKNDVNKLFDYLKNKNFHLGIHSNNYYLDTDVLDNPEKYHVELLAKTLRDYGNRVDCAYDYYDEHEIDVYKIIVYLKSSAERDEVRKEIEIFEDDFEMVYSDGYTIEFSKKGVSKGNGLKYLCDLLGIDIKDAIAVGDNENDLVAIKMAGLGIAMDNATDKIKNAADVIVASNDNDGCKEAIEKYLLKNN